MGTSTVSPHVNTSAAQSWLLWAGFILVSLNLRLIFSTVGPLLENLQLGFTSTLLVTTLPLALLGLFSMAGVRLRHWLGEERALFFALILLSMGCSVRGLGEPGLIVGTFVGSAGIAVMNVIMPVLARKRFGPQRMGMVMGIYALMLGAGAVLGASASLPLFQWLGADRASAFHALGLWAIPALLALLLWAPQVRHAAHHRPGSGHGGPGVNVYRDPTAWAITLFFGLQVLNLFVFLPWMPTLLRDRGADGATAAVIFSLSQLSLMLASFVMPLLAARTQDHRPHIAATILLCLAGTLGLMYSPLHSATVWAGVLGAGQGAGLSLGTFLFVAKSASIDTATRISAMAQTVGYLIAAAGPLMVGALYQHNGDWNLPVLLLAGILLIQLIVALPAGRNVKV
ncbi:MFS transporter [Pseudomonas sp. MF4836]|uniref:MFS transporter n=1 Tax=Pseudomonas sp. MF4836 TaxID=1960827 RepID=UPI000998A4F2|nr:MFS transporter [Pseudomonas sp. MF4836]OOW00679.1 hypothetical protein MF4836_01860 [Pseudomonas sp. MF4836]